MNPLKQPTNRRAFLGLLGAGAATVVAASCSKDEISTGGTGTTGATGGSSTSTTAKPSTTVAPGTSTTKASPGGSDMSVAAAAAGLEVLAVSTYGAALDAATAGKLGEVPPAVAEFVTTAKAQHQAALDKWNGVLTAGGKKAVSEAPEKLQATVNEEFGKVTDVVGAAKLALMLEEIAAATYLKVIPTLSSKDAIELAGSIQVVDAQHAAVLHFVLGEYPVPETFAGVEKAAA